MPCVHAGSATAVWPLLSSRSVSCTDTSTGLLYTVNFFTSSTQLVNNLYYSTGTYSNLATDGTTTTVYYTLGSSQYCNTHRTMTVTVTCAGSETKSCSEASSCTYVMAWATPLACSRACVHVVHACVPGSFKEGNRVGHVRVCMPHCVAHWQELN